MDLFKAFDTVNHNLLLQKLYKNFGIRGKPLDLIKDYLQERYQYTSFNGINSETLKISCGVPQGSCLGPLFFLLYINDLPMSSNFNITLFADDAYLALSSSDLETLERKTNIELCKVDRWFRQNRLSINYNKTFYMLFNKHLKKNLSSNFQLFFNQKLLQRQQAVKYLGITIDDKLNWHTQLKSISLQLARCSGVFYRLRNLIPIHILKMIYFSLVCSRLQYGILSWGTAKKPTYMKLL